MYSLYMCILLYVIVIWCNSISKIYCYMWRGRCILSICAFCYMWNLFDVTVFHRTIVNWGDRCILCICAFCYMRNLFGVTVFHRSIVNWSGDGCILSVCGFCYMWHLFGVMVLNRFVFNWSGDYMCPHYMCIVLYVIVIGCNDIAEIYCQFGGVDVSSVYVHSAMYETYMV